jgi:hypothetical protein
MANDFVLLLTRPDATDGRVKVAVVLCGAHLFNMNLRGLNKHRLLATIMLLKMLNSTQLRLQRETDFAPDFDSKPAAQFMPNRGMLIARTSNSRPSKSLSKCLSRL